VALPCAALVGAPRLAWPLAGWLPAGLPRCPGGRRGGAVCGAAVAGGGRAERGGAEEEPRRENSRPAGAPGSNGGGGGRAGITAVDASDRVGVECVRMRAAGCVRAVCVRMSFFLRSTIFGPG